MSGFLLNRRAASEENAAPASVMGKVDNNPAEAAQVQAITASAIFAMLVSKGIISADEAAEYMEKIGLVLQRDVGGALGAAASTMIRSYGKALAAAGE